LNWLILGEEQKIYGGIQRRGDFNYSNFMFYQLGICAQACYIFGCRKEIILSLCIINEHMDNHTPNFQLL